MKHLLISAAGSIALLMGTTAVADHHMEYLSADKLEAALVGNSFVGGMGGGDYASYFAEDGMYYDANGSGEYEITDEGVCYPGTDFGCYAVKINEMELSWFQDGENTGTGMIVEGDPQGFFAE